MIHSSKTAYVAIADHRDANGAFKVGDIVIVDYPEEADVLAREGSIDLSVVIDASLFTPGAKAKLASEPAVDEPADADAPEPTDEVTTPVATGHRPSAHRMQTAPRAKARRS